MIRKIITSIAIISSLGLTAQKSFEKKTNVVAFGADLGIYSYESRILSSDQTESNLALNKQLSLYYERGMLNWLGIGAKVQLSDYFTDDTIPKPSFKAIDASLLVNAHVVRSKHVDMLFGVNVGYSHLNWEANDTYVSTAKGGGLTYDVHFQPHFYFGNHVGIFLNLAYIFPLQ